MLSDAEVKELNESCARAIVAYAEAKKEAGNDY